LVRQPIAHLFAVAALVFVASSCSPASSGKALITDDNGETIGMVSYIDLEGGFYGIMTEKGEQHRPMNLHVDYRVDGLRITYRYQTLENVPSIHMWGTPIEILEVRKQSKR